MIGQDRLAAARVLVVGAGGLVSPVPLFVAAFGVGQVTIADDDVVSLSTLQRQVLHATSRLGDPKIASAADRLGDLNPDVRVVAHSTRVTRMLSRVSECGEEPLCSPSSSVAPCWLPVAKVRKPDAVSALIETGRIAVMLHMQFVRASYRSTRIHSPDAKFLAVPDAN